MIDASITLAHHILSGPRVLDNSNTLETEYREEKHAHTPTRGRQNARGRIQGMTQANTRHRQ